MQCVDSAVTTGIIKQRCREGQEGPSVAGTGCYATIIMTVGQVSPSTTSSRGAESFA